MNNNQNPINIHEKNIFGDDSPKPWAIPIKKQIKKIIIDDFLIEDHQSLLIILHHTLKRVLFLQLRD